MEGAVKPEANEPLTWPIKLLVSSGFRAMYWISGRDKFDSG